MKGALAFAAISEAATGLALLIAPSLVGQLLLGEQLSGVATPVARVAGIALIALGIACWPGWPTLPGMLIYSGAVTRRWLERRPSVAGGRPSSHTDSALDARRSAKPRPLNFSSTRKLQNSSGSVPCVLKSIQSFNGSHPGSCTRRRGSCAAAAAQNPCRSWSAAAKCARRSRWSADRNGSPRRSPAAWCASPPGRHAS
jgi:hypothetical protein